MAQFIRPVLNFVLLFIVIASCQDILSDKPSKYDRPQWLAGKLYTQVRSVEELSTFAHCIILTGIDSLIDVSGSYTIFAPTNDAFESWFNTHPEYNRVEDIPIQVLSDLVKYHIVQNPWSKLQLMSLDVHGWIDTLDPNNNKPRGFKRETILRKSDPLFGVEIKGNRVSIVDADQSALRRRVINARKYAPIFFKQYFDIYNLSVNDYEFYFDRPFGDAGDLYFAGARVMGSEIFAENGFVYKIDRVVEPLKNTYEILANKNNGNEFSDFLALLNQFPSFTYNHQQTMRQPGASEGLVVDSLFNLTYPSLAFDFHNERTRAPRGIFGLPSNVSIRYHHGFVAPTNQAFRQFVNEYFVGLNLWGSIDAAPSHLRSIIANTHMSINAIYPTDFVKGFHNGENDIVTVDAGSIVHKEYGSNSSFIGVNNVIVPRAFSSVIGPVYLQRGYSTAMYAIERTGMAPTLKRRNQQYMLFVESDASLLVDSSLMYDFSNNNFSAYVMTGAIPERNNVDTRSLRMLLMNHVGTALPRGHARKEFIPNLAGNYLIVNNETGEVSGTAPTTFGFLGTQTMPNYPRVISADADNGITYDIDNWFSFRQGEIYPTIMQSYPHFHALLQRAGLALTQQFRYSFISDNETYTIFIPTADALAEAGADNLTGGDLRNFILMHFIQGDVIFTDGNKPSGYYQTLRIDERSTAFNTVNTWVYVNPGIDVIDFRDRNGNNYLTVNESDATNITTSRTIVEGTTPPIFPNVVNQAVIHEINKAFVAEQMNTN
jgi:uncharacterized surface protein with fasciclin (FAS1) repeats